ncbi:ATP-binding protein [Rhizobium sp. 9140]|uniref:ATP-binding protein n=1 Tax=Rhizobium sp. 9140 TaxID=1761900 RepID=UPI00079122C3|nr:ATP-binding protein [Rhizobium sp. 9140]CZT35574.1 hypothetical protein GA0004734_00025810 [Rhizobium sp. 9140]
MVNNELQAEGRTAEADRRDTVARGNRFLGRVIACNGSHATIAALAENGETSLTELWSVGRLVSITVGVNRVVALVSSMRTSDDNWAEQQDNIFRIDVELVGEVRVDIDGREAFSAGISQYPYLGAIAHRIRTADLARIYDTGRGGSFSIGKLTQDESLDAAIHIPSMLSKHFAVVGTTGVGKSTAVTLLLRKAIEADPKLRILILDPHNEFAAAFPDHAVVIDTDTLDLPFWLMRLEEFAEVVFRGRPAIAEELDILRDLIPDAKKGFKGDGGLMRRQTEKSSLTADTPVPYRIADLMALIDERIGRLEGRTEKPALRSLKVRIMAAVNDPRYTFMFSSNTINDTILETIAKIFRIPGDGRPITTFQLAGIPSEVVNSVASVLCRMAFEIGLWSNGGVHMLVVCEEAHRYVPSDQSLGFLPTRQAIARIAKEGRKYGVSLGMITQRPGELDPTILSQCSTVFAMRLSNDRDQDIIRSAIPDSSVSTMSFLSSIGNGEAIAFGEAVSVPMRMRFERIPESRLPKAAGGLIKADDDTPANVDLRTIVARMRASSGGETTPYAVSPSGAGSLSFSDSIEPPPLPPRAPERQESQNRAETPASSERLESYRPDMLPRVEPQHPDPLSNPQADRFNAYRRQILGGETDRRPPDVPVPQALDDLSAPTRAPSLRETLLRKPLGSMIRK